MNLRRILVPLAIGIALITAACSGSAADAGPNAGASADLPPAAGTCLEGAADCDDTGGQSDADPPPLDDEPNDGAVGGGVGTPLVVGGGLTVAEALATDATGPLAVGAFYFSNGSEVWLCDSLAESYPPQCAETRIAFDGETAIDPDDLVTANGITWSAQPVTVIGSIVDGVFVATLLSR